MVIFTSICNNYLHKASILAQSVKQHIPNSIFVLCLVEREISEDLVNHPCFDYKFMAKDMWEGYFDGFIFKHSIVEACTAVKGQFFRFLYQQFPDEQQFVYLDPDICVYDDFVELKALLETRPIVLCPHLLQPGNIDMELSSTAHGVYNLGFLAVNRMQQAIEFIDWWASRLLLYCYDDIPNGIFTDQKWIELAPCFFDVEILKHKGYDFATWSLLDCGITESNGKYFVKGEPLRFVHYSGFGGILERCMDNWLSADEQVFRDLYASYRLMHEEYDSNGVSKTPWSYSSFLSGEHIDDDTRVLYRKHHYSADSLFNPFDQSNAIYAQKVQAEKKKLMRKVLDTMKYEGVGMVFKKVWERATK